MAIQKSIGAAADQVAEELGMNSIDRKVDRRNIIFRMDSVRSELMGVLANGGVIGSGQTQIRATKGVAYDFADVFYTSRTTPVTYDTNRGKYVSTMPTDWVSFAGNNGIRLVRPRLTTTGSNYFIFQQTGASLSFGSLESSALGGMIGIEIEGNKLYYNNMPANTYTEVLVTYIPTLTALGETEMLPCDGTFASILLDKTRDSFLIELQVPEDKTVNNNSQ